VIPFSVMAAGFLVLALVFAQALASVDGTVVRDGKGTPIAQAQVTLSMPGQRSSLTTTTDDAGKFTFKQVPPGEYRLAVTREGYVSLGIGQRQPGPPARPISLSDGQELKNVVLNLKPLGAISGRLLDRDDNPQVNVEIEAAKYMYRNQSPELSVVASARTNDLGEFRIHSLPSGRYLVRATPRNSASTSRSNTAATSIDLVRHSYFPGTLNPAAATQIDVPPGTTFTGVDWTMPVIPTVSISGKAINGLTGQPLRVSTTSIMLSSDNETSGTVATGSDGKFEFRSVEPGVYTLSATVAGSEETHAARVAARMEVDVQDKDVEGVSLVLQPGFTVPGRIVFSDGVTPSGETPFGGLRVELRTVPWRPQLSSNFPYGPTRPAADGTFSLPGVLAGPYRLFITDVPQNRYVKTARFGASDALDSSVQFDPAAKDLLEIVLGAAPGALEATVVDGRQMPSYATVVLIPEAPHRGRLDVYRSAPTDASGHVRISSLVPGEYKVFAFDSIEAGAWFDPEFLRIYEERGHRVSISEGGNESVQLTAISAN
jgi:protocatechuate 3,4-dioxygenase beta subunit